MTRSGKIQTIGQAAEDATKTLENGGQPAGDNKKLKSFLDRLEKLHQVRSNNNADIKSVFDAAEDAGFERSDLKFVLRMRTKEISQEHRDNINWMLETLGEMPLFAFASNKTAA